jgi:hypothetical protein
MAQLEFRKKSWEIPDSDTPCESWTIYYDQLEKEFGKQRARQAWLITWEQNGSTSCTTNAKFNRWLKRKDIDVSSAATRLLASGSEMVTNVVGMGANLTTVLKYGVPVALVGVIAIVVYRFATAGGGLPNPSAALPKIAKG